MTRIISGAARGRRLVVPEGRDTRPTSDRAREGLFSTLADLHGPLTGAHVLDLYAGSGAMGFESLSRGAAIATMVESATRAVRAIRANDDTLDLPGAFVVVDRVERALAIEHDPLPGEPFDIVTADPPYAVGADTMRAHLTALIEAKRLTAHALAVIERSSRDPDFDWPDGWAADRVRTYGEAALWYGRASD